VRKPDGTSTLLHAGDTLAEVVSTLHTGRAMDGNSVKLLVLYTGAVNGKLTVTHPEFVPATAGAPASH
jgi:hypothetical protein